MKGRCGALTSREVEACLAALPRVRLCTFDTPLQRLPRLEKAVGCGPVYLKRDDLNGVGPGGNKVRPLEYLLGEAMENHCGTIIASGQENSNLCSIAAAACCRVGLPCILVHNNHPPEQLAGNILLNKLTGVEERYIGPVTEPERDQYVQALARELEAEGCAPYVIENGATTVHGAVGYVNLLLELERCRESQPVRDLFVPGGNGGIAAGAVFGAALLGGQIHVHVITVEHTKRELEEILTNLLQGLKEYTGWKPEAPFDSCMTIYEQYRGDGWGISTPESDRMVEQMAQWEGIFLERIYTSKTAWGMCDLLRQGVVQSTGACLLHSGGFGSLFYQYR